MISITNKATPEISDYEFDNLLNDYSHLKKNILNTEFRESPTDQVGSDLTDENKIIPHKIRMYSLENAYSLEEIADFFDKLKQKDERIWHFTAEVKIDGFSINLYYENGELQYATTRGDGFSGEDVTANVKTISDLPVNINYQEPIEIRGEIFLPRKEFARINLEREDNGERLFANPRNAAAGTIKLKDIELVRNRKLDYRVYSVGLSRTLR